ncbi:MAG: hypothetical protein WC668_02115 [Patescibacteria group bacterium]|jgi:hypothetical protein
MIIYLILSLAWLLISTYFAGRIILRILPVNRQLATILGIFFSLAVLSLIANIFTAWLALADIFIISAFAVSLLLLVGLYLYYARLPVLDTAMRAGGEPFLPSYFSYAAILFVLAIIGGYFVSAGISGGALTSPWQVINPLFLAVVFVCSLAVLYLSQSRLPLAAALFSVLVFSLLIHSYLLVYPNGFGGDRFRHLGSEYRLLSGLEYQPTLLARDVWYVNVGGIKIPQALVDPAKLSYGAQWSLEVVVSKITSIDVFQLNRFLLPLFWSLFLPLIIFVSALLLYPNRQFALLSAVLSSGFYLWQYYGGQGLPATWGLLNFAFGAMFWLAYLRRPNGKTPLLAMIFTALNYFNYSLAFILLLIFGALSLAAQKRGWLPVVALLALAGLVALDFVSSRQISFQLGNLYQAWTAGNLWYFNSGLRLWPQWGLAPKIFDLLVAAVFIFIYLISLVVAWQRNDPAWRLISYFSLVVLGAYFISWGFLTGEHLLARRLTLFAVFPILLLFCQLLSSVIRKRRQAELAVVVLALLIVANYYSGPVMDLTVTDADWQKAQAVWQEIKSLPEKPCVKEPLPVILALEAVSAKEFQETTNNIICDK